MPQQPATDASTGAEPPVRATIDAGALRAALSAVDALVAECVLRATPDGLVVDAQDPATVALVSMELPAEAFERYRADGTPLGVDLERLGDVVSVADRDAPVALAHGGEGGTLDLRVGQLAYTLGLIDPDAVRSPPDVDYDDHFTATVHLDGAALSDAVAAADMVADHCEMGVDPDAGHLYVGAEGDLDTVRVEHPERDCETFEGGPAHSLFSTSYLAEMAGVVPDDATARLRLGQGAPLELSFPLAGGTVTYYLAPRRQVE
jgi:proliferating cell nuclear antigen